MSLSLVDVVLERAPTLNNSEAAASEAEVN